MYIQLRSRLIRMRMGAFTDVVSALLIGAVVVLGVSLPAQAGPESNAVGSFGWTPLIKSPDTKAVYVSNSTGNDSNNGLSESKPVKTIEKAKSLLRHGYPDWMLLKTGDTWNSGLGQWKKSGRSAKEPMVVTSYGSSTKRPLLKCGEALGVNGGGGSPGSIDNLWFVGLHFWASSRDPYSSDYAGPDSGGDGFNWVHPGSNILVEDCVFATYRVGIQLTGMKSGLKNFRLRGSVVRDCYGTVGISHSQGLYATNVKGLLVQGCVFDHNGWNEIAPGAEKTIFNHNLYIDDESQYGMTENVTVIDNIIARGASHGLQLRPGGTADRNLFVGNSLAMFTGRNASRVRGNVVLEPTDIADNLPRGWGIEVLQCPDALLQGNIVVHQNSSDGDGPAFNMGETNEYDTPTYIVTMTANIVHDWNGASLSVSTGKLDKLILDGNDLPGTNGPASPVYVDPSRDLASYQKKLGGSPSSEAFLAQARTQSKATWKPQYSAPVVVQYIADGYQVSSVTSGWPK